MAKKSASSPKRLYWDACTFLSLIEGEPSRLPVLKAILQDMDRGKVQIFTSTLSITEVAFAKSEKDGRTLNATIERQIDKLWNPPSPFNLVDVYRSIAKEAKSLVRKAMASGVQIKPADAIHLVTAKKIGASQFQTYDDFKGRSAEVSTLAGMKVCTPAAIGLIIYPPDSADDRHPLTMASSLSPADEESMRKSPSTPPQDSVVSKPKKKRSRK